jgi:Predicted ATPase
VSFIDTLGEYCEVIDLFTPENIDYRRLESSSGSADATETVIVGADADARERLERSWARLASSSSTSEDDEELVVGNNRAIRAKKRRGDAVWFTFDDLCGQASRTHPTDFIELARRFKVICVQDVPRLPISTAENEARRFINLIDVLYEHRTVLLTNLHASPDALFAEDRSAAAEDRDLPLRERTRIENDRRSELHVTSTGGSSGRSTTMLAPELEWSATGRVGASLADVSSVNFVTAASPRARSRLHHKALPPTTTTHVSHARSSTTS